MKGSASPWSHNWPNQYGQIQQEKDQEIGMRRKHVAQPPLIKWYRNVSVWISTINYRTVTQCTGHQHHCHPGDAAPDANWISHHDKTSQSRCHIIWCRCHGVRQPGAGAGALLRTPSLLLFVALLRHRFIMNTRAVNKPSRSFTVPGERPYYTETLSIGAPILSLLTLVWAFSGLCLTSRMFVDSSKLNTATRSSRTTAATRDSEVSDPHFATVPFS